MGRPAVQNQRESTHDDRHKWVALANTTAAMFMATLDGSIVNLPGRSPGAEVIMAP
jgi:hypothetical protein